MELVWLSSALAAGALAMSGSVVPVTPRDESLRQSCDSTQLIISPKSEKISLRSSSGQVGLVLSVLVKAPELDFTRLVEVQSGQNLAVFADGRGLRWPLYNQPKAADTVTVPILCSRFSVRSTERSKVLQADIPMGFSYRSTFKLYDNESYHVMVDRRHDQSRIVRTTPHQARTYLDLPFTVDVVGVRGSLHSHQRELDLVSTRGASTTWRRVLWKFYAS